MKKEDMIIGGYYGFGSIGDEAILDSILESISLSGFSGKVYVINSRSKREGRVIKISRLSLLRLIYTFARSRIFIFGGGSLLQDSTSRRSLFYYEALLVLARALGCRIYIFANGIGPVSQRRALKKVISFAHLVSVRDPDSYEILKRLNADSNIILSADPVFKKYTAKYKKRPLACLSTLSGRRYFAISLRSCKRRDNIDLESLCAVVNELSAEGLVPLYVPMQREYDLDICRRARLITGGVIADAADMDDVMHILSGAELSIGMRLHFLIASAMVGTPLVALSYDRKVKSAVEYLGLDTAVDAFSFSKKELLAAVSTARSSFGRDALFSRCEYLATLSQKDGEHLSSLFVKCGEEEEKERREQVSG